eukprot:CAMPEP_0172628444 /NCGR_PEP_ID=MMETSP1068-20121228/161902_1 /TAXON_ID=35684 /ORGANISM="Pseudopedinella elastica, Strain CCMP716" /LENGTH=130 /DNA_ID=CAMNT_0013438665 /DNA_START=188 /DNA_END=580 /DNA_ORIENTATION=-
MSEVDKAQTAAEEEAAPTIFDKIIAGEIPCTKVYEDDEALAFRDISPQGPVHVLVIPKQRAGLTRLTKATPEHKAILGHLMFVAAEVARQEGLDGDGCRFVVNDGKHGCQTVYHLHVHVIGGKQLGWPPG